MGPRSQRANEFTRSDVVRAFRCPATPSVRQSPSKQGGHTGLHQSRVLGLKSLEEARPIEIDLERAENLMREPGRGPTLLMTAQSS